MDREDKSQGKGLRAYMQELIAVGLIASSVSLVWALVELRSVIARSRHIEDQIVHHLSRTASLADRATTHLDEFEQLKSNAVPDLGFREPPAHVLRPEDQCPSITPQE